MRPEPPSRPAVPPSGGGPPTGGVEGTDGGTRRTGNVALFFGGELGSRLLAFVATAYLAVALGPERFGIFGFALAVYGYLAVLINAGFADVGSRAVARDLDGSGALAVSVTAVQLLIATVLFAGVWLVSPLFWPDPETRLVVVLTCLLLFAAALDTTWVFRGREKGLRVGVSLVVRRLVYAVLVFALIGGPEDLVLVPLTQLAGEVVGVLWLGFGLLVTGIAGLDLARGIRTYVQAGPLIAGRFLRTSIITLDVILLGFMVSNEAVGLYTAPYRVCFLVMALASAVQVAYLADVSRSPESELRAAAGRHLETSLSLGVPITIGGILLAEPIILEVFGPEYVSGTRAFQLLLVSVGLLFAFSPLHNVLLAQDRLRLESWFVAAAAVGNLVLNLLWIPRFGILGAAAATVAAEVFILGLTIVAVGPTLRSTLFRPFAKPLLASIVMAGGLVVLAPGRALLVGIPLGALLYGVSLLALGGLPEDVRTTLAQRFGGPAGT